MVAQHHTRVLAPEKSPRAHYESSYLKRMNSKTSLASRPGPRSPIAPAVSPLSQKDIQIRTTSNESKRSQKQSRSRSNSVKERGGKEASLHRRKSTTPSRRGIESQHERAKARYTSPQKLPNSSNKAAVERQRHLDSLVEKTLQSSTKRLENKLVVSPPTTVKKRYASPLPEVNTFRYWTSLSIKVSTAMIKAGSRQNVAEAAQYAVMEHGQKMADYSNESLNNVASKASLATMLAGGSPNLAAVATVTCLRGVDAEDDDILMKKPIMSPS